MKVGIGEILVVPITFTNPYRYAGPAQLGKERVKLLAAFHQGNQEVAADWQLWRAPAGGGARRITVEEVDWERSSFGPRAR